MHRAQWFTLSLACALALVLGSAAQGQLNELTVKGKVVELGPLVVAVKTETGETWLASVDPNRVEDGVTYRGIPEPKIEVSGTEGADVLRPGMYVRFEADVEKKKVIKAPVTELTIVGNGKDTVFGLLPNGAGEAKEGEAEQMLVVGQLSAASRGSITVQLPEGKSIKAKLAPDAVVKIASNDYSLARPGDDVELKGLYGKAPRLFATSLMVKRAPKVEKTPRRPAATAKKPDPKKPVEPAAAAAFGEGDPREEKPADKPADKPAEPVKVTPGKILKVN